MRHAQEYLAVFDLLGVARFLRVACLARRWADEAMRSCIQFLGPVRLDKTAERLQEIQRRFERMKPRVEEESLNALDEAMGHAVAEARLGRLAQYLEQMQRVEHRSLRQLLFILDSVGRRELADLRRVIGLMGQLQPDSTLANVGSYLDLRSTPSGLIATPTGWESDRSFRVCRTWNELPLARATAFAVDSDAETVRKELSTEIGWRFARQRGQTRRAEILWQETLKSLSFWGNHGVQPFRPGRLSVESQARRGRHHLSHRTPTRVGPEILVIHASRHREEDPHTLGTRHAGRLPFGK